MPDETALDALSPVDTTVQTENDKRGPEPGIALCLSGGGYRAMLFHLGALWRMREMNALPSLKRISSVSGGSIVAGLLGLKWNQLKADGFGTGAFEQLVVGPIRNLAGRTIDVGSILSGVFSPGTVADKVRNAYKDHLFGNATLQDLPSDAEGPRFVINATNVQTGSLWRFMKPYMADYQIGRFGNPTVPLAQAVAASSAFPPFLSPLDLEPDPNTLMSEGRGSLAREPYTTDVLLTDGGVYDNLGLETAWKRYQTILVSDGGGQAASEEEPKRDWPRHSVRVFEITDGQVRSLRKRQIIGSIIEKARTGSYWGIRDDVQTHLRDFELKCPHDQTMILAHTATRLKRLDSVTQERLINWGYAVTGAATRRWLEANVAVINGIDLSSVCSFPYVTGVG